MKKWPVLFAFLLWGCDQKSIEAPGAGHWLIATVAPDSGSYAKFHVWRLNTTTGALDFCSVDKGSTDAPTCSAMNFPAETPKE